MSSQTNVAGYEAIYQSVVDGKSEPMAIPAENLVRMVKLQRIAPAKPGEETALDFGCGDGRNAEYLEKIGFRILGTDVSQGAIEATNLRMRGKPAQAVLLDPKGSPLPAGDRSISLIVAWEVLHWLGSKELFNHYLREFARVLKPQGHLIFTMPAENHYIKLEALEVGESLYSCRSPQREDFLMYSPNLVTLKDRVQSFGFALRRVKSYTIGDESPELGLHQLFSKYVIDCVAP